MAHHLQRPHRLRSIQSYSHRFQRLQRLNFRVYSASWTCRRGSTRAFGWTVMLSRTQRRRCHRQAIFVSGGEKQQISHIERSQRTTGRDIPRLSRLGSANLGNEPAFCSNQTVPRTAHTSYDLYPPSVSLSPSPSLLQVVKRRGEDWRRREREEGLLARTRLNRLYCNFRRCTCCCLLTISLNARSKRYAIATVHAARYPLTVGLLGVVMGW